MCPAAKRTEDQAAKQALVLKEAVAAEEKRREDFRAAAKGPRRALGSPPAVNYENKHLLRVGLSDKASFRTSCSPPCIVASAAAKAP